MANDDTLVWEVELDRLELGILQVERLIKAVKPLDTATWEAPSLDTPLPLHLIPRAVDIHQRQGKVLQQLLRAMQGAQRQSAYLDRGSCEEQLVSRYLDISA